VQHVSQGFRVHQAVLDRHAEEPVIVSATQAAVHRFPNASAVLAYLRFARPVLRLILRQITSSRIDAKGKETVERRIERVHFEQVGADQIPVKRLQVSEVEDEPMTLLNRPLVECLRLKQLEEFVRAKSRRLEIGDKRPPNYLFPITLSATTRMATIIQFERVDYAVRGGRRLLTDVSFQIQEGEMLVLLGRSGSGKTTTLKLVNRLLEPGSGRVLVEGKSTLAWDPIRLRRQIGYVIQDVGLFPHFTVERNVGLVPSLELWPAERIQARVRELLELVGLDPEVYSGRFPRELSGGQRQRVGVARALAADPPMLLLDEPFGALDPITRSELQQEFRGLQQRLKKTMIFVTHDIREAFLLGTQIGLMQDGRLVTIVRPQDFLQLDHPEAKAFARCLA
jgi:osmoprotectant transport system ATP-binding protein